MLTVQELRGLAHPVDDRRGEALILSEGELEHVVALAADSRQALIVLTSRGCGLPAGRGGEERDGLEKVGIGDFPQDPVFRPGPGGAALLIPMLPEVELIGRERRGEELEDGERDTARVDLLEDLAHRPAWSAAAELDHGQLILVEPLDDLPVEGVPELDLLFVVVPELLEAHAPVIGVGN
jgi:hypothetical protein